MLNPLEIHPPIENCPLCNGPKCFKGLCFNSGNRADMEEVGLFNPYSLTDDYANAKSCFKCGNPYGELVYVGRSSQPIGCTGCCKTKKPKDSWKNFNKWVKTHFAKTIAENKRRKAR